jgi:hypothetical protein
MPYLLLLGVSTRIDKEKAIRGYMMEIKQYLKCSLVKGKNDKCMKAYDVKESKCRGLTK